MKLQDLKEPKRISEAKFETADDFAENFPEKLGSAFDMWMSNYQKKKMFTLYQGGATFVSKTFDFDSGDKDKDWAKVDKWKASMKAKGFKDFADEENYEAHEFIMVKKGLREADETPPEANVIDPNKASADPAEQTPDEDEVDAPPVEGEDVGSVSKAEGFVKSKTEMFADGATRPVTLLTKNERVGGMEITFQYVINPKTGSWRLRACLKGQSNEDMVEFSTGEDPTSLIKSLKKKKKVTPHQLVDNLNPPADKEVPKEPVAPLEKSEPEEEEEVTEGLGAMEVAKRTNLRYCSAVVSDDGKWYVEYQLYGKDEKPHSEGPFPGEASAKMRANAIITSHMKKT